MKEGKDKSKKILLKDCVKHEPKRNILNRFLIILGIVVIYSMFSIYSYGLKDGILVSILTWSLFVFCTPIADAGFLLDFPVRLLTKIRMIYSEIFVWIFALGANILALIFSPDVYNKTELLKIFKVILTTPIPFWAIIFISFAGTFLSIYFGDELLDVFSHKKRVKHQKHKNKYRIILFLFLIILLISLYYYLLNHLGIHF